MKPRQTFEQPPRRLRPDSAASEELLESDCEEDCASRSGQPSPVGSVEACEREDSAGLLSPPSSQPSLRASLLGSRNGSAHGSVVPSAHPHAYGTLPCSQHDSRISMSSASLALGRARALSLIHSIGGASRSSIELIPGRVGRPGPASSVVRL